MHDDERDYAEEQYNRALMHDESEREDATDPDARRARCPVCGGFYPGDVTHTRCATVTT
jgi:hypothetical protein